VVSSAFLLAIVLPVAGALVFRNSFDPSAENRPITPFPTFEKARAAEFPVHFERWFEDRFAFRRQLITAQSLAKVRLGVSPSSRVVIGRDGWLFYAGERSVDLFRHTLPFGSAELKGWREALEARRAGLARRGIRYLLVIPPDKETVYPEFMPRQLSQAEGLSRLDELVAELRQRSRVEVVDLRPALSAARGGELLYHRTDTHWNDRGAFAGYRPIAEKLSEWFPAVRPLLREACVETRQQTLGGDLSGMLALRAELPERESLGLRLAAPRAVDSDPGVPVSPNTPPHAMPKARAVADVSLPRALVLRDSFAEALLPFLAENFQRSVFLFTHRLDEAQVERERPDVVIEEIVERYLVMAPPDNLAELASRGRSAANQ
jgi:hypothetical protein